MRDKRFIMDMIGKMIGVFFFAAVCIFPFRSNITMNFLNGKVLKTLGVISSKYEQSIADFDEEEGIKLVSGEEEYEEDELDVLFDLLEEGQDSEINQKLNGYIEDLKDGYHTMINDFSDALNWPKEVMEKFKHE